MKKSRFILILLVCLVGLVGTVSSASASFVSFQAPQSQTYTGKKAREVTRAIPKKLRGTFYYFDEGYGHYVTATIKARSIKLVRENHEGKPVLIQEFTDKDLFVKQTGTNQVTMSAATISRKRGVVTKVKTQPTYRIKILGRAKPTINGRQYQGQRIVIAKDKDPYQYALDGYFVTKKVHQNYGKQTLSGQDLFTGWNGLTTDWAYDYGGNSFRLSADQKTIQLVVPTDVNPGQSHYVKIQSVKFKGAEATIQVNAKHKLVLKKINNLLLRVMPSTTYRFKPNTTMTIDQFQEPTENDAVESNVIG